LETSLRKFLLPLIILIPINSYALDQFSVNTAAGSREQQLSVDAARLWQISDSSVYLGLGIRGTSQWAAGQTFKTAPANQTTGSEGPQVIFKEDIEDNIDDLTLSNSQVTSINLAFYLLYQFSDSWSVGTNIDVIGGSFGATKAAKYNPKSNDEDYPDTVSARPSPFNLLLISDNDIGSLNSEFFVKKKLKDGWSLKFGANFAFTEYTTTQKLRNNNDRFRHKSLLPTIGFIRDF
jgi:hypothetical protein